MLDQFADHELGQMVSQPHSPFNISACADIFEASAFIAPRPPYHAVGEGTDAVPKPKADTVRVSRIMRLLVKVSRLVLGKRKFLVRDLIGVPHRPRLGDRG